MNRKPIFAANWKLNKSIAETHSYFETIARHSVNPNHADVMIAPPYTHLPAAIASSPTWAAIGAQNVSAELSGAFTGEVSIQVLAELGCQYVIVGHSERRALFGETDALLSDKVRRVIQAGLTAIFCVGETLEEREAGATTAVISTQIKGALKPLAHLIEGHIDQLVVAYEPVWAIGTGKVATPDQAQQVHHAIRAELASHLGLDASRMIRIQYGGSVKPDNIVDLMKQPDIDGALVGGASLSPDSFYEIIKNGVSANESLG